MRHALLLIVLLVSMMPVAGFGAEGKKGAPDAQPGAQMKSSQSADEQAIQESAKAFTAAFDKGDAKAVAALWTKDCEYIDEAGRLFRGRDAVEKQYAAFFAAHPGLKMDVSVDSLKVIGGHAAIEDGTAVIKNAGGGTVSRGAYTAFHLKQDGTWLIASVRERSAPALSNRPTLKDLEWLVGDWVATKGEKHLEFGYRWIADKKFLELTYTARDGRTVLRSGTQIIGRDALTGEVVSWSFDSTGGYGRGEWKLLKKGVMIHSLGTMADGMPTSATEIMSKGADAGSFTWKSVDRRVGGQSLGDSEAVQMKRKTK